MNLTDNLDYKLNVEGDIKVYKIDSSGNKELISTIQGDGSGKYEIPFSGLSENGDRVLIDYSVKVPKKSGTYKSTISYMNSEPKSAIINTHGAEENYLPELF